MAEHIQSSMVDEKVPNGTKVARKNDGGDDVKSPKKRTCVQQRERPQSSIAKTESERRTISENKKYTKEQVDVVQRILKCENLYDVLEVPKDASVSDIKKAFRKLAMLVHPDKNGAPDANKAMQMVAAAGEILADADKRQQYDHEQKKRQNGNEGSNVEGTSRGLSIDAGSVATGLLIILGSVALYHGVKAVIDYFRSDPDKEESVYSFKRSNKYSVERRTGDLKIPYYVKRSFQTDYTGALWQLETFIEEEYQNRYCR